MKRTVFLSVIILFFSLHKTIARNPSPSQSYSLSSPDKSIQCKLYIQNSRLLYTISYNGKTVMLPSVMGIVVDDKSAVNVQSISLLKTNTINATHPSRGVHSTAIDHCNQASLQIKNDRRSDLFTVYLKVFNNGIAFCYGLNTTGTTVINADSTTFALPAGSIIWRQGDVDSYEGAYIRQRVNEVSKGDKAGPPLLVQTADKSSYLAITEGGNTGFAGMSLAYDENNTFKAVLKGTSTINGNSQTPWRIIEIGKDLNTLVNCDIIQNVSPSLDKRFFPDGYSTSWLVPGKSVWSWLAETNGTLSGVNYKNMLRYSTLAAQLGFQYNLVDEGWAYWKEDGKDNWTLLKQLVDSSAKQNVKIFVWKSYGNRLNVEGIEDSAARMRFFSKCKEAGVAGVKIDFFPDERQSVLQWYEAALRDAARMHLLIDFHGTDKPTGQSFTYPNEMTREGIRGLENSNDNWPVHNTTLPFTRFLAGPADYTPFSLSTSLVKGTTPVHQLATLINFTSPFMCIGVTPDSLLASPLKNIIKDIPTVWDETIVLPQSEPGVLSAFARRKGNTWYIGVLNGDKQSTLRLSLSMLPKSVSRLLTVHDDTQSPGKVLIKEENIGREQTYNLMLQSGGGFVAKTE